MENTPPTTAAACRRFSVSGRVQGVFFRDSTRRVAEQFGLTGYAKNLPDGTVEVVACGASKQVSRLAAWLEQGPPMASVVAVDELPAPARQFIDFSTG